MLLVCCSLMLAACSRQAPPLAPEAEPPALSITRWSERTELFLEHEPLVAGETRRLAVHLTDLKSFRPVEAGRVTVVFAPESGPAESFTADTPSSPGIFGVDVRPARTGRFGATLVLESARLQDRHDLGELTVHVSASEAAVIPEEASAGETIAFSKEQQWMLDFSTTIVERRSLRNSIEVTGEIRPRSGGEIQVVAPIAGRLAPNLPIPFAGSAVRRGETIAAVVPFTPSPNDRPVLELAISEAQTNLELARHDLARVERLLSAGAIPARRVEEARGAEKLALARLAAARQRLAHYESSRLPGEGETDDRSFRVAAPIDGVIAGVFSTPGAHVNQGDRLVRIVAVDRVHVAANVPEADAPRLAGLTAAEVEAPGLPAALPLGRLVSRGSLVDPQTRTTDVLFELSNPSRRFAVGQAVRIRLFLAGSQNTVVAPATALVDDGGRPVVFVQTGGESFERRPVRTGLREGERVEIVEGLAPGERVVATGGYLIRLASLSKQMPAEGHVH
ncbi:MAG: efflux RND transporter periplasmic adaptor subunit [Bryobacteraceae bacterium]